MDKQNINKILEFISKWGNSRFSVNLQESTAATPTSSSEKEEETNDNDDLKALEDRMEEDEDNRSVFYTTELPAGARRRKPSEKEGNPLFGSAMKKLGRFFGKTKNRVAPEGSRTSKVLGGIGRAGKAVFRGVGSDISDLLTSPEDYDYVYDEIEIPEPEDDGKKLPAPKEDDDSKKLPAPKEDDSESVEPINTLPPTDDDVKKLPAPTDDDNDKKTKNRDLEEKK